MFSHFSSFLTASSLTPVVEKSNPVSPLPSPSIQPQSQNGKDGKPESGVDELGVKKRKERSSEVCKSLQKLIYTGPAEVKHGAVPRPFLPAPFVISQTGVS